MTLEAVVTELRMLREEVGKICADVGTVKEIMVEMMEGKKLQRKKDAERKKSKRERDAEERLQGKIPLPDNCPVDVRDKRLKDNFLLWAHAGMEFGRDNDVRNFFTYLTLAWNQTVYHEKVITRSGNRPHVWRGNVRHRSAESWSTIFGTMTGRVTDMVLSDLSGQLWFAWGFAVFYPVWEEMKTLPGFDDLPDRFVQACLLVQGGYGSYCINADSNLYFDPNNSIEDLRQMRRFVPALWYAWSACREGLEIASYHDWKVPFDDLLRKAGDAYEKTKSTRARKAAGRAFLDKIRAQRRREQEMVVVLPVPTPEQVEQLALKRAISLSLEDQKPSRPQNPDDIEQKTPSA